MSRIGKGGFIGQGDRTEPSACGSGGIFRLEDLTSPDGLAVTSTSLIAEYVIVAGGGGGGQGYAGGGGAGGYRSSVIGELSGGGCPVEPTIKIRSGQQFCIEVGIGAWGLGYPGVYSGSLRGGDSRFGDLISCGGGSGGASSVNGTGIQPAPTWQAPNMCRGGTSEGSPLGCGPISPGAATCGGSGGGGGDYGTGGCGIACQGCPGGGPAPGINIGHGGGGARSAGCNYIPDSNPVGRVNLSGCVPVPQYGPQAYTAAGNGGCGISTCITGQAIGFSGGGGGTSYVHPGASPALPCPGLNWGGRAAVAPAPESPTECGYGGGFGSHNNPSMNIGCPQGTPQYRVSGRQNSGGGAGGTASSLSVGGSGIIMVRYPSEWQICGSPGLTISTVFAGSGKCTSSITNGVGNVSWSKV